MSQPKTDDLEAPSPKENLAKPPSIRQKSAMKVLEESELTELLEAAQRILPEYADKLDRIVQTALTIWEGREKRGDRLTQNPNVVLGRDLDLLQKTVLERLGGEFRALSEPLKRWIHKLSAAHEEGRLTEIQRMELGLRLIDLEMKFLTAQTILGQLGVL